ncbi:DUF5064 family protein [Pseudomonas sp. GD03842]|uniref:DUF5064 family protein n=1 Tax=unclassified Pseudomonas TaxID=196821 RepID=UPI000D35BD89|nr:MULTISPECIES: DUF5064 family protein [unclassified Pseudomonas]MDH0746273.1 DUF5064 family protein [Pseudomonas sp. GD03842]RAU46926.1 DUF5064 family protein [Pseudomonas sp. RIT 409]RAU54542.1 DUF5064 family protein [Pseudomonas sp. RIT 412]
MFEPGHLHIAHAALQPEDVGYDLHIRYELSQTDAGPGMHFILEGEIDGKSVNETFDLPKDLAYNFAHDVSRLAEQHGLPKHTDLHDMHGQYDAMFKDIRDQLDMKSGDPVKPEHLG